MLTSRGDRGSLGSLTISIAPDEQEFHPPRVSSNATKVEAAAGAALNRLGEIPLNNAALIISTPL